MILTVIIMSVVRRAKEVIGDIGGCSALSNSRCSARLLADRLPKREGCPRRAKPDSLESETLPVDHVPGVLVQHGVETHHVRFPSTSSMLSALRHQADRRVGNHPVKRPLRSEPPTTAHHQKPAGSAVISVAPFRFGLKEMDILGHPSHGACSSRAAWFPARLP
jgi:hypothetical protein